MKMGQSAAMLLFTGVSTIGVASGAGYRIAVCAAVLCGIEASSSRSTTSGRC